MQENHNEHNEKQENKSGKYLLDLSDIFLRVLCVLCGSFALSVMFVVSVVVPSWAQGQKPVVFSKQVLPILREKCWSCHSGQTPTSGYSLETRDKLLAGGRHGAAIIVGKGKESLFVRYLTGEVKPLMPPSGGLDMDKIALVRRWIDEGAKVDSFNYTPPKIAAPKIVSHDVKQIAPITAMAFSPDGTRAAIAGYRGVRIFNAKTSEIAATWGGAADQVQAVAWSSDGKLLAMAGGVPGERGEIVIADAQTGKPIRTLGEHSEVVYAVAFKPNSHELASGSLDKTARIWNADTGQCSKMIKDHADAIFGVAYSPDGKYLATASGDRTAKLFDPTQNYKRVATLNAHQDGVTRVAFSPDGKLLATGGWDKTVRVWEVKPQNMDNPLRTMGTGDGQVTDCQFSPAGNILLFGGSDTVVRVYNGTGEQHQRDLTEMTDWVSSLAVPPDGKSFLVGTQDGKLLFWDAKEFKLTRTIILKH
jgi:WD40 repeat protein